MEYLAPDMSWGYYSELIDYEIQPGAVTVFFTASDFIYGLFMPEDMQFRCVIARYQHRINIYGSNVCLLSMLASDVMSMRSMASSLCREEVFIVMIQKGRSRIRDLPFNFDSCYFSNAFFGCLAKRAETRTMVSMTV